MNRMLKSAISAAAVFAAALGCASGEEQDNFSEQEWELIRQLEPLGADKTPPPNRFNKYADSIDAARLGQMIFWDPGFSTAIRVDGPSGKVGEVGKVSCGTCHDPKKHWVDSRTKDGMSHGTAFTTRTSPGLENLAWYEWFTWAGRLDSLSTQGANAPEAPTDVATTRLFFAHVLYKKYRNEYNALFSSKLPEELDPMHPEAARFPAAGRPKANEMAPNGPWEMMTGPDRRAINEIMANSGKAIEAYERKLISNDSPFERYVAGDRAALTPEAKRGLRVFIGKASCNECHTGPIMSDNKFHNVGVPQAVGPNVPMMDGGRFQDLPRLNNPFNGAGEFSDDPEAGKAKHAPLVMTMYMPAEETRGQFRTQGLHACAETAPYFHNGSVATLDGVVRLYNKGGGDPGTFAGTKDAKMKPLDLTEGEIADLVEFLKSLTGNLVPEEWQKDTHRP